ncbi:hypothetical protein GCM10029978_120100 [Actinoallomurus acanthiterrae]
MQRGEGLARFRPARTGTAGKRMSDDFTQAQETPWRYGFLNLMRRFVDVQFEYRSGRQHLATTMEKFRLGRTPR